MKKLTRIVLFLVCVASLILLLNSCKKYSEWDDIVKFTDGSLVKVYGEYSQNREISIRDVLYLGGGNEWNRIWFEYKGIKNKWDNRSDPIILNCYKDKLYIVGVQFNEKKHDFEFVFFRYDDKWVEISSDNFPKAIAICNLGLNSKKGIRNGKPVDMHKIMEEMNPNDSAFSSSYTAHLWFRLTKGMSEKSSSLVDANILSEFKKKYILGSKKTESHSLPSRSGTSCGLP